MPKDTPELYHCNRVATIAATLGVAAIAESLKLQRAIAFAAGRSEGYKQAAAEFRQQLLALADKLVPSRALENGGQLKRETPRDLHQPRPTSKVS